jgi:hypothetical protein
MITQTPKEKAEELVDVFMNIKQLKLSDYSVIYYPTAKQCALIAVNEIINSTSWQYITNGLDYWNEVKHEIENL